MNNHVCIFLAYNNVEHVKRSFNSMHMPGMDYFIVENKSENSDEIREYFAGKDVVQHVVFEENIAANAIRIVIDEFYETFSKYEYVTITDGDIFVYNMRETMREILDNLSDPSVMVSSAWMYEGNDYLREDRIEGVDHYILEMIERRNYPTGAVDGNGENILLTVRGSDLAHMLGMQYLDRFIHKMVMDNGKRWVHTARSRVYHLTWDLYHHGNEYYEFKKSFIDMDGWSEIRTSDFKLLKTAELYGSLANDFVVSPTATSENDEKRWPKIAVVTATYRKLDGSTRDQLSRALKSVRNQTYGNWKMFLIGDEYDDNDELMELSRIIPEDKLYVENLPEAVERRKYDYSMLWCVGGTNANVTGIKKALEEGFDYVCILNHDDEFLPEHLQTIAECILNTCAHFIVTKCGDLPDVEPTDKYTRFWPGQCKLFISAACTDFRYYGMLPRNAVEYRGNFYPSDADLWDRINEFMIERGEHGIFVNETTCVKHGGEDPMRKADDVKKYNRNGKLAPTSKSLEIVRVISNNIVTDHHHHFHILYDIGELFEGKINYVEIGCYAGKSASLMLQRPFTNVYAIDTAEAIPAEVAMSNMGKWNHVANAYVYITGSSNSVDVVNYLEEQLKGEGIDILFIDGSHLFGDVVSDFIMYSNMVNPGGYVVFDDYNDKLFSPEVHDAVEYIVRHQLRDEYDVIGTFENTLGAFPVEIAEGNCFILRKRDDACKYVSDHEQIARHREWRRTFNEANTHVDLINYAIRKYGYKRYLEIGVEEGICFSRVEIEHKESVDPVDMGYTTHVMPSDEFFDKLPEYVKFDVIFVDGLHIADQVYRDILNALDHLSDNGVIFCHDMNPPFEICQRTKPVIPDWNGDCWKAFARLRSEREDLEMFTVDIDFGVGVIRRGRQHKIEVPEVLDYQFLDENREELLNLVSVDEFHARMKRVLAIGFVYNEIKYMPMKLEWARSEGLELYVIDNMSTDGTWEWLQANGVPSHRVDTDGSFDLRILQGAMLEVLDKIRPDWVVYQGADMYMMLPDGVRAGIREAELAGCNALHMDYVGFKNTGEDHRGFDPYGTYNYAEISEKTLVLIFKYRENLQIAGDNIMGMELYDIEGAIINYGMTKTKEEREETYERRKKAWENGTDRIIGEHYNHAHDVDWKWNRKDLVNVGSTKYWPYVMRLFRMNKKITKS